LELTIAKKKGDIMLAEEVKNYTNIFHACKGGKNYLESENKVKKVLINAS
jgi:hypothetical protein